MNTCCRDEEEKSSRDLKNKQKMPCIHELKMEIKINIMKINDMHDRVICKLLWMNKYCRKRKRKCRSGVEIQ